MRFDGLKSVFKQTFRSFGTKGWLCNLLTLTYTSHSMLIVWVFHGVLGTTSSRCLYKSIAAHMVNYFFSRIGIMPLTGKCQRALSELLGSYTLSTLGILDNGS